MSQWIFYLGIVAVFVTLGVLAYGIGGFGSGKMTAKRQNLMMRLRIGAQAAAVLLLVLAAMLMGD